MADLDDARVIAAVRLLHDVGPPGRHDIEEGDDPGAQQIGTDLEPSRGSRLFIVKIKPTAVTKAAVEPTIGQGLGLTR